MSAPVDNNYKVFHPHSNQTTHSTNYSGKEYTHLVVLFVCAFTYGLMGLFALFGFVFCHSQSDSSGCEALNNSLTHLVESL